MFSTKFPADPFKSGGSWNEMKLITDYKIIEKMDEIQPEDYLIALSSAGNNTCYTHLGSFFGIFDSQLKAIEFMLERIKDNGYYPNIYLQNERGDLTQITFPYFVF